MSDNEVAQYFPEPQVSQCMLFPAFLNPFQLTTTTTSASYVGYQGAMQAGNRAVGNVGTVAQPNGETWYAFIWGETRAMQIVEAGARRCSHVLPRLCIG